MITRDVHQLQVVPAFAHRAKFSVDTVAGYTCTEGSGETSAIGDSGFMPGFVIDRLGLQRTYHSLLIAPVAFGHIKACSTASKVVTWGALSVGLQHTSASGGTYANYSTEDWMVKVGLWRQTTATSTGSLFYTAVQRDVGLSTDLGLGKVLASATSTAAGESIQSGTTSTQYMYYVGQGAAFDLGGAKRYLRPLVHLHLWSTGTSTDSLGLTDVILSAAAIFGEPSEARPPEGAVKRILVTSGCST